MEMPRLETPRLLLRGIEIADLDAWAATYADPVVAKYLGHGQPRSREETLSRMTAAIFRWNQYRLPLWAVTLKESGRWIGRCGFQPQDDATPEVTELAYSFARDCWSQGYASEAALVCIAYAFDVLKWDRVVARARPENVASLRVMEKLGFRRERETENDPAVWCVLTREGFFS